MIPRILDMLFLSAPHLAGDGVRQRSEERRRYRFYPRHPRGWRLKGVGVLLTSVMFLSTPPSRVATAQGIDDGLADPGVSIHATLAGGDPGTASTWFVSSTVSIHATLAGGDQLLIWYSKGNVRFLSTPPSRVATNILQARQSWAKCFYPRHPRGWRLVPHTIVCYSKEVSTHATLAGGDAAR